MDAHSGDGSKQSRRFGSALILLSRRALREYDDATTVWEASGRSTPCDLWRDWLRQDVHPRGACHGPHSEPIRVFLSVDQRQGARSDVDLQATPQPSAEVLARFEGKRWLQNAISALEGGAVPARDRAESALSIVVSVHQRGISKRSGPANGDGQWRSAASTYVVETVDYAGELAKPSSTDLAMAQSLMEHLQTCDGLLILAEAPRRGKEYGTLHRELTVLRKP